MKKVVFSIAIVVVIASMVSCGSKTAEGGDNDSTAVLCEQSEQVRAADSVATAPEDLRTVEAVEAQGNDPDAEEWDVSVRTTDLEEQKPRYEAIFRDANGNTIQVAEGHTVDYPQDMLKPFGNVWQADVNFDGHTDIMICLGIKPVNGQTVTWYEAWLYNPQTGKFYSQSDFRDINNPEVDTVNKYITGHYLLRDGKTKQYTAYAIQENGNLKKLKEWQRK